MPPRNDQSVWGVSLWDSGDSLFLECGEYFAAWFKAWIAAGLDADCVELSNHLDVDFEVAEEWCVVPDVPESDFGKFTSPECGKADTAEEGGDGVAEVLPQVEAFVTAFPYTVDWVGVVGLSKHLLKGNLKS